jgi:hypothetical protein
LFLSIIDEDGDRDPGSGTKGLGLRVDILIRGKSTSCVAESFWKADLFEA